MIFRTPVLGALLAALVVVVPAVVSADRENVRPHESRKSEDSKDGDVEPVGRGFEREGNGFTGTFVSFTQSPTAVAQYTVGGARFLDLSIATTSSREARETEARGSVVHVETSAYRFKAHDNPVGGFRVDTRGTITATFPAGSKLLASEEGFILQLPAGDRAFLYGEDLSALGDRVTARDRLSFRALLGEEDSGGNGLQLAAAAAKKILGAQVRIASDSKEDVESHGNVTVATVTRPGNVTLIIDGHGLEGRVIAVDVDPGALGVSRAEDVAARFDNESIARATNLTDALDPDDDGLNPEYYLVHDAQGFHFIVSVPHYSVHTLSILAAFAEVPPSVVAGALAGAALVATGGWVLFKRPKKP